MNIIERLEVRGPGKAFSTCCELAAMAGKPRPNFVEWGKVYETPLGSFRLVSELRPNGGQFHGLFTVLERVSND